MHMWPLRTSWSRTLRIRKPMPLRQIAVGTCDACNHTRLSSGAHMIGVKKPANIIYAVDESPPPLVTILNGCQHVGVIAINLVYPLLVFRAVDAPIELVTSLVSAGMVVLAIATVLQARRLGPVGSGFMCPATFTAT